jgi:catechol 2,3-dioxygenase-like lactoylglutathione lyase family enzyme
MALTKVGQLFGQRRPRKPGARGTFHGRGAIVELRLEEPGGVRVSRRFFFGSEHHIGGRVDSRPGGGSQETKAAVDFVRRQGWTDEHQQELPCLPGRESKSSCLARGLGRSYLGSLEERPLPDFATALSLRPIHRSSQHGEYRARRSVSMDPSCGHLAFV